MTTTVTVHANHGWPVRVTARGTITRDVATTRVPAGATRQFYVHSGMDLHVHEIQPGEADFDEEAGGAVHVTAEEHPHGR